MSVRASTAWMFSGQIIAFVTNLGTAMIVARLLSPHEMGIYAVAFAVLGVLQMAAAFDLSTYVTREKELGPRGLDAAFTVNAILCAGLALATFLLSFAGAAFLQEPAVADALQWLAIGPLLTILEFKPAAMLQREMKFKWIAIVTSARTLIGALATIAAAYHGASYMSLAYGNIAFAATSAIGYNLIAPAHLRLRFSAEGWRRLGAFGVRMMSISGLANLVSRLSDIILGRMLGLAALGLYSRASSIAALIFQNVYGTATRLAFAQLATDYRRTGELRATFLRSIQLITAVMWPMLLGLAVLSKPVILLMFGPNWVEAAVPLSLLMVAQFTVLAFGMNWELFVLRDETALQTRFEAIRAVVSLLLFTAGCMISIEAAAASRIVDALVGLALYLPHMNRLAGTRTADLLRLYGESLLLALAAVIPAAALMLATGWDAHTPLPLLGGSVAAGVLLWLGAAAALRHPIHSEVMAIGRRMLRRRAAA